ncbi:MAG: fused MFS/spermidine synthase, partial [Gammaproteobacteria bacterium]|nr:fused MFS/spermidine synthase [Gammaproteobacteria bacterium]
SIYIAVTLNLLVAFMAWGLNKKITLPAMEYANEIITGTEQGSKNTKTNASQNIALFILIGTGFASIASEIGWTKYLSIFTGTTIYGFAAILGIFLIGIASGSWVIKNYLEHIKNPRMWLAISLLAAGAALIFSRSGMSLIPSLYEGINHMSITGESKQWIKYLLVFCIIFPPTFILGAIFPLNIKLYCGDLSGVQARVGKAYAVNTIASIGGSIAAGFWIIPTMGTDFLLSAMYIVVLLLPLLLIFSDMKFKYRAAILSTSFFLIFAGSLMPQIDYKKLIASVAYKFDTDVMAGLEPEFLFVKEGKISVISVVSYDGKIAKVQANGLNESLIDMNDASNGLIIESLLAYMPYFIHKNPESAFVVGYGGGITTRAFTQTDIKNIRVVELEPTVIEAGKTIKNGPVSALNDPRVTLNINDARNTLLIEENKYDIIAAQPSHPWLAGASNVFTQEFFHLVKTRLNDEGIFSQWINLFRMDVTTLRSLFKAFYSVFPEGMTFANLETGDLMLLGSSSPMIFDINQAEKRMNQKIKKTLSHYNILEPNDLLWYFALSREEAMQAAGDIIPNRDTNIFSEVRLSAMLDEPSDDENPYLFLQQHFQFDILPYLKKSLARSQMYSAAKFFLYWNNPETAFKIAKQLHKLDKTWGKSLKHEIYFWRHDWDKATQWYNSQVDWLDVTHIHQLEISLRQKDWQTALSIINKITGIKQQKTGYAMLLFYQNKWEELSAITPISDEERQWILLGKAKSDLVQAGSELADIMPEYTDKTHQVRMLIQYYATIQNNVEMNKWSRYLITLIDDKLERYTKLSDIALGDNDLKWNQELLNEIRRLDPENTKLEKLVQKHAEKEAELKKQ